MAGSGPRPGRGTRVGAPAGAAAWVVSRSTGPRAFWGAVGIAVFGAAAAASAAAFARAPHVDSFVLVLITLPFLVMAVVLAGEAVGQGLVRVDDAGYATPLGRRRAWADVLAIGAGQVEGHRTPVVAVRTSDAFPVTQDVFPGFVGDEADRLVEELRARSAAPGFADVTLSAAWWASVEQEAERAASVVRSTAHREPVARQRVEFGYPGLASALSLDYGTNAAGERVELLVRSTPELAVTTHGRRWLRQHRRRSADPATQVGLLFEPHTSEVVPSGGTGFDRLVVTASGRRPLTFNAEEPDRF